MSQCFKQVEFNCFKNLNLFRASDFELRILTEYYYEN
jgi:hypothetical protein